MRGIMNLGDTYAVLRDIRDDQPVTHDLLIEIRDELRDILAALRAQQPTPGPHRFGDDQAMGVSGPLSEAMTDDALIAAADALMAMPLPPARPAGSLHSVNDLPDRSANPGAINPDVTQENMATTIFVSGFTKTIRPPVGFTNALKRQQAIEYGYPPDIDLSTLEEDHIVPLEAGGAPHDPANLWPQPREGQWGARVKDLTENAANAALRSGAFTLQEIRDGFCQDWKALHEKLFSNPKVVGAMMMMALAPPEDEP